MSLPVTLDPLPSSYTWGKVVGRVIHAIADNDEDTDDKPQARPAAGKVHFTPKDTVQRVYPPDADYAAIVLRSRETANLSATGRILDGEGRQGIWLVTGIWTVTFEITGNNRVSIPAFDIEVTTAHNDETPLDLASAAPYVPPSGTVVQTLLVPAGGTEGQTLVRAADGGLAWGDLAAGGAVDSVNGQTGVVVLDAAAVGAQPTGDYVAEGDPRLTDSRTPTEHTHPATDVSDSTAAGRAVMTAANAAAARTAIGAGTSNLTLGTTAGTAAAGNDARLSDTRTPTDGSVTAAKLADNAVVNRVLNDGAVTDAKVAAANKDGAAATPSLRTLGTGANQAAAGNDARLSDARTPTAHTHGVTDLTTTGTRDATTFLRGDGTWAQPPDGGGGVTDHGALTGLSDNDHPQYALAASTPAFVVHNGTSWPARTTATSDVDRVVFFIGNPGGAAPVDMQPNDVWTQG